jgi:hypothetical protein
VAIGNDDIETDSTGASGSPEDTPSLTPATTEKSEPGDNKPDRDREPPDREGAKPDRDRDGPTRVTTSKGSPTSRRRRLDHPSGSSAATW